MSTVSSLSSRESVLACVPEQPPAIGGTGSPPSPVTAAKTGAVHPAFSRTNVEEYRANDGNQGLAGKALEEGYAKLFNQLPPGGKVELSGHLVVKLEVAGELKVKLEVERLAEGAYRATLRGGMGLGLATPSGKGGPDAAAMLGGQGAVVLRFDSAAEAADRLAALTQTGTLGVGSLSEWVAIQLKLADSDASLRSARATQKLRSFEAGVYVDLRAELDADLVKVGGRALNEGTFRVDVAEGKLIYECSLQVQLQGAARGPSADGGRQWAELLKGELGSSFAGVGVESRTLLHAEVTLSKDELVRLQEGKLRPEELMKRDRIQKRVAQEVKGSLVGAEFSARRELPVEALRDLTRLMDPKGEWEVAASMKANSSLDLELNAGVAQLKGSVAMEVPLFDKGSRKMKLGEVASTLHRARSGAKSTELLLQARRAMGR